MAAFCMVEVRGKEKIEGGEERKGKRVRKEGREGRGESK